jgi:uncharacterized protein
MFHNLKSHLTRLTDHLIESPCIAVCIMHTETGLCKGCYRTMAEIEGWPTFTGDEKRKVIQDSAARKTAAGK